MSNSNSKRDENVYEVPFQVQSLIDSLKNKQERVHVRGNYRMRLEGIKRAIDRAIYDYDVEMGDSKSMFFPKGKR
jgi:hypothetical protein